MRAMTKKEFVSCVKKTRNQLQRTLENDGVSSGSNKEHFCNKMLEIRGTGNGPGYCKGCPNNPTPESEETHGCLSWPISKTYGHWEEGYAMIMTKVYNSVLDEMDRDLSPKEISIADMIAAQSRAQEKVTVPFVPTTRLEFENDIHKTIKRYETMLKYHTYWAFQDAKGCFICRWNVMEQRPNCNRCPNRPMQFGATCTNWPSMINLPVKDGARNVRKMVETRLTFLKSFIVFLEALPNDASFDELREAQWKHHADLGYFNEPTTGDGTFIEIDMSRFRGMIPKGYDLVVMEKGNLDYASDSVIVMTGFDEESMYITQFFNNPVYGFLKK